MKTRPRSSTSGRSTRGRGTRAGGDVASWERVQVVCAGTTLSRPVRPRLIRIYSTGGVEDAVVASLGPVVACAAHGKYLAIAYHGGIPDGEGRQHVQVRWTSESRQTLNGNGTRLPHNLVVS